MKLPLLLFTFIATASLKAAPIVLLNDQFNDGDRTTQNLPSSSRWYYMGGNGSMTVSDHTLNWNIGTGYTTALTYFSTAPVALEVGDSLTASFTLSFDNIGSASLADSLRIGIFNSGGARIAADAPAGRFTPIFNSYTGYYGDLNPLSSGGNTFRSYRRGGTAAQDLFTLSSLFLNPSVNGVIFQEDTPLSIVMNATRTESGMLWSISIGERVLQATDVGSTYFSFDTLALYASGPTNTAQNFLISNVYVAVNPSPIPEVETGLLLLLGVGVFIVRRRRQTQAA